MRDPLPAAGISATYRGDALLSVFAFMGTGLDSGIDAGIYPGTILQWPRKIAQGSRNLLILLAL
jgi:hypothetical protein